MQPSTPHKWPHPVRGFRDSHLGQAWLVLLLALVFGSALAAVQTGLSGIIDANIRNETLNRVPELIWGAAEAEKQTDQIGTLVITPGTLVVAGGNKSRRYPLYKVDHDGELAGWVAKAGGQGYADKIVLLLGLDPGLESITGLFVLEQKETPGLGNKIIVADWRGQFAGKATRKPLVVQTKGNRLPNGIDAITGATISSRSVTSIVNQVVAGLKGHLTPAAFQPRERR